MTAAAAWPVCTICYEDLRPLSDQHLHCLPACGHVFHALCVEQWLEYCPGGRKKLTCPICKQPCGAAHPPTRLFFQSTGSACPTQASSPSRHEAAADAEALAAEVARLEQKAASLGRALDEQRDGIQKLNAEVARWRGQAATAEAAREAVRKEKEFVQQMLNVKTEELSRKTSECGRLQERSLVLAKELAALKLSTDMNLEEEEILKLASLGNHANPASTIDVLKRSLALRNKSYKDLMAQCNLLGRSESRAQQRLEKAKELIKKLRTRVLDLEKDLEEKENDLIRDLRSSKKFKAGQTNSGNTTSNNGFPNLASGHGNHTMKLDEVMQDPCNKPQLVPEAKSDLNIKNNLDSKSADVIDLDADDSVFRDEHKDFRSRSNLYESGHKESTTCETSYIAQEASFPKHSVPTGKPTHQEGLMKNKMQSFPEIPVLRSVKVTTSTWEKETLTIDGISKQATRLASGTGPQQVHNFNCLSDDFQTPTGILGGEGARKNIGKWCKGMATPGSLNPNANKRNLISVGPDGRGGKVKILRDPGRFQDSKTQALWPKAQKVAGKGGQAQIDHFFGKR